MYGVRSGSNNAPGSIVGEKSSFTQEGIAQKLGMDVRILQNYKILSEMIPELGNLIESNLRQRVVGNANPIKLGKCFQFLNNWYGIQHGATSFQGNQHNEVSPKVSESPNQEQLAEMIGNSVDILQNYKILSEMISENVIYYKKKHVRS